MSPPEIAHRISELLLKQTARGFAEGWHRYEAPGGPPAIAALREAVAKASPEAREAIAEAAYGLLDGRFHALGCDWPRRWPGQPLVGRLWQLDPVTGRLWAGREAYCFDIAYRHERRLGDIKYVWELNRLQFLQPLAAHVLLSGNQASLNLIEDVIASWHEANPPFRGVAWASGIECALRAISLIVVASLAGEKLSRDTVRRIREILAAHAFWIARFPSRFSSANNHVVAEAAGELLIALAMTELPDAAEREAVARAVLEQEAARQILPDGAGAEQSPTYGAFTAELLLLSAFAARAADRRLGRTVEQRLSQFARFISWIADGKGRTPAIGDDDEGRVLSMAVPEPEYTASVAWCIDGYLRHAAVSPKPRAPHLREALFGTPPLSAEGPSGLATFRDGGLTVVREARAGRRLVALLDHGPLGYLSIAAHGHADALSLMVTLDDEPLLVDPGTYLYHSGAAWRDWLRGTGAHNTLTIEGADQSEISGPFNWRRKASARLDETKSGTLWELRASHDGYVGTSGARHERTVTATEDGLWIRDKLIGGQKPLPVEIAFQLAPSCEAFLDDQTVSITRAKTPVAKLVFETPGSISTTQGGDRPSGGWVSPAFGVRVPAWRIVWRGHIASQGALTRLVLT